MRSALHFQEESPEGIPVVTEAGTPVARLQVLSPDVVRVEEAVEQSESTESATGTGFVDEPTFTVVSRRPHRTQEATISPSRVELADITVTLESAHGREAGSGHALKRDHHSAESPVRRALTQQLVFSVPEDSQARPDYSRARLSLTPVSRYGVPSEGVRLPRYSHDPRTQEACKTGIWYFRDAPRCVNPWSAFQGQKPWNIEPFAGDWYIFAWQGDAAWLREEFLSLTGSIPVPPLWMFGVWHSRYYPYAQQEVIDLIDEYRNRGYPLDAFVIDTDWRTGASRGYLINETLFPDMQTLFKDCHSRNVRVMFNDHPEHRGRHAFDDDLIQYRRENLARLLNMGLDAWWFDRNWREIFLGPDRGLGADVWGQFLYWEIDRETAGRSRVPLLSMRTDHPAGHRYPIWWTGDIHSDWATLREAIEETLDSGTQLFPYTGQDIGGHAGFPSPEQLVRWLQWGAVSPTFRLHCGPMNRFREPWKYDETTNAIATRYARLRMQLIPLIYSTAWQARRTGTPILRDASLVEPQFAGDLRDQDHSLLNDEFFLGDDLWVAPIRDEAETGSRSGSSRDFQPAEGNFIREVFRVSESAVSRSGATPNTLDSRESQPGRLLERRETFNVHLSPTYASRDRANWGTPFFVRWRGSISIGYAGWYRFLFVGSGIQTLRLGESVHDRSIPDHIRADFNKGRNEVHVWLPEQTQVAVEAGYFQSDRTMCSCCLSLERLPDTADIPPARRDVHLPPGDWVRLADGSRHRGNRRIRIAASLWELPMFLKRGGIIPVGEDVSSSASIDWNNLTLHVLPPADGQSERTFYTDGGQGTDDTLHPGVQASVVCVKRSDGTIRLSVEVQQGPMPHSEQAAGSGHAAKKNSELTMFSHFSIRLHLEPGETVDAVLKDGQEIVFRKLSVESPRQGGGQAGVPGILDTESALCEDAETVAFDLPVKGHEARAARPPVYAIEDDTVGIRKKAVSVEIVTDRANRTP